MRVDLADGELVDTGPERATPRASVDAPFGNGVRPPDGGAPTSGGWRWIPDPAEDRAPEPAPTAPGLTGPLIRALAWASLHTWG